jgi:hypothetical protein
MLIQSFAFFASSLRIPSGGPPRIRGVQGVDDQAIPFSLIGSTDLATRYASLEEFVTPGNRRYNLFWTAFEPTKSSTSPLACGPGFIATPLNESDRVARGYLRYHCYSASQIESVDKILTMDFSIGAASTAIVYGAPTWAVNPNCTGFPWPPNTNYRFGCIPWDSFDDWEDYIGMLYERWHAPWGEGPRLSGFCIWNEIQSMGWSDPSPILPNRFNGTLPYWSPAQVDVYTGAIATLFDRAARAAARQKSAEPPMLWLSTDHFVVAPHLVKGDVGHLGLYEFLDSFWRQSVVANALWAWGVCVHPYDAGDPREDLSASGIYTFATLRKLVASYQCSKLVEAGVPEGECWLWPQTLMWASEQGWPQSKMINKTLQARNICYAHELSLAQGLWSVTHNTFQTPEPSSQGGSGDFSLIDEPPTCAKNLTNCDGLETWEAYKSTAPSVFGFTSAHYCCLRWRTGCVP